MLETKGSKEGWEFCRLIETMVSGSFPGSTIDRPVLIPNSARADAFIKAQASRLDLDYVMNWRAEAGARVAGFGPRAIYSHS